MQSLKHRLEQLFEPALAKIAPDAPVALQATKEEKFGDYQCNAAMGAAKKAGRNPREVAQQLLDDTREALAEICEPPEIAGPGFLNLKLKRAWLEKALGGCDPGRWEREQPAQTVVVDYSSPNVAKEMHVGHIRSTILGDAICRVLSYGGDRVIRQNHLGDWGTQFGMLVTYLREHPSATDSAEDLGALYREANALFTSDAQFQERARQAVVALHHGDAEILKEWAKVIDHSRRHFQPLYERMGVLLTPEDECGESFYRDRLPGIAEALLKAQNDRLKVVESDGALVAFVSDEKGQPLFKSPEDEPLPLIIRKSDGAFLYATTDLAALRYRVEELHANRIIVITGAPQIHHFKMFLAVAEAAGWLPSTVLFEHITFGSILGSDRKPFKTRSGDTVKLKDLLDEAVERAQAVLAERDFTEEERQKVAETVGLAAIKYADLAQNRSTDYIFSWDKMLSFEGNTAPYLMFAYSRLRAIGRKGDVDAGAPFHLEHPLERSLAIAILRFAETLDTVQAGWKVNLLADYLYTLAGAVMRFCEECPVLKAPTPELRASRLRLCDLTAAVLQQGLALVGIPVLERM